MKYLLSALALTATLNAAVLPRQVIPCTFYMSAVGDPTDPTGSIVETTIGENRIGGSWPQGVYSIDAKVLTDAEGHNCSISSTTAQFQCIQGSAVTLFTLGNNGNLLYNDTNEDWLACPATGPGEDGSYNIFTQAKTNTTGCETIQIVTGGFSCAALGRPTSSSTTSIASATSSASSTIPVATSTTSAATSCPTDITSGPFEYPHLIVPVSPESPDHAFGNQFTAHITPQNSTIFNFDVPSKAPYTGICALLFLLPVASNTQAGTYNFTGIEEETEENGGIDFSLLNGISNSDTTYNTQPAVATDFGKVQVIPGNAYTVATFACPTGKTVSYAAKSAGGVGLEYFENSAASAIGLYMVPCS
ncbi:hypothetical protein SS1G_05457 [Sclerotinia sclerotiorum 1980 UF-70]|uniref:Uncharacterized protein n=2 Tax=Sclerotinia sclerotiorum (strain ATCC 18683 / 1980 / Ss-1) TaxID=665079 RepID=A7EJG4_SCLS1|nr:hypothetical protein SS1G_05457 [Sclerotinia sclerotiorum 1980 UF-70]APA11918.1 hypothetical protein sscle_08g066880 [Sclerotinia sclerotiorum 1980 UF-70]EDO02980.1 hypothetical protein SS1G_05457 [Sclerotinia sclerotiorum 1980 UF-70]